MNAYLPFLHELMPFLNLQACAQDYTDEFYVDLTYCNEACHKNILAAARAGQFVFLSIRTRTATLFKELNKVENTQLWRLTARKKGYTSLLSKINMLFRSTKNLMHHDQIQLIKESVYFLHYAKAGFLIQLWHGTSFCLDTQNTKFFIANSTEVSKRLNRRNGNLYYASLSLLPAFKPASLWSYWCQRQDELNRWPKGFTSFNHTNFILNGKTVDPETYVKNCFENITVRTAYFDEFLSKL